MTLILKKFKVETKIILLALVDCEGKAGEEGALRPFFLNFPFLYFYKLANRTPPFFPWSAPPPYRVVLVPSIKEASKLKSTLIQFLIELIKPKGPVK